jgi:hypothetical protein
MWLEADAEDPATQPYTPLPVIDDPSAPYSALPDIWARIDKDPEDYVVADNIFFRAYRSDDPTQATIDAGIYISPDPDLPQDPFSLCYFQYGRQGASWSTELPAFLSPFWITESNATTRTLGSAPVLITSPDLNAQLGSPLVPRIPEILKMKLTFLLESPYPGAPDFRRQLEQVIDVPAGYVRTRRN